MDEPMVSVICLCYNQADYVEEAIESVLNQTYSGVELIVVNDGSSDSSMVRIQEALKNNPEVRIVNLETNLGNCTAFNRGLALANGDFIIDLSADDVLLLNRIEVGLSAFSRRDDSFGVHFSNANIVDAEGRKIEEHFKRNERGKLQEVVPEGDVYCDLVQRYIVCAPTMMVRKAVFDYLGGYDESLVYEDFDFWVRSSRKYYYCFTDEILVNKRRLRGSHGSTQYGSDPSFLESTFLVCEKIQKMNISERENKALKKRIGYEMRQAILARHFEVAGKFLRLFESVGGVGIIYKLLIRLRINLSFLK